MTDYEPNPKDPIFEWFDADADGEVCDGDDRVEAQFIRRLRPTSSQPREPYDLGWLFLCWAWEAGYRDWSQGVRALARVLRGLKQNGLIERRTIRRAGRPTHHGFVLTEEGQEVLRALSGDWIKEVNR